MRMREFGETKDLMRHTLPLRQEPLLLAALLLPKDMTEAEAERVCQFVRSLALPAETKD